MTNEQILQHALAAGFTKASIINTSDIVFDPSFRTYCAANVCGQYGTNASCPPNCGSPEVMKQRILAHKQALVLQSVCDVGDYSNIPALLSAKKAHHDSENVLLQRLRTNGCHGLFVGASGCALCSPCAQSQGKTCPFPDQRYSCMSAYCIYVKDLAEKCAMDYACGTGRVAFFGMYAFD